jgi:hypothetical protein
MRIQGKVVAKIQQEGGASLARILVYKKKKTAAGLMRIFDIVDDGELNIGDQVVVEVYREVIKQYEPDFTTLAKLEHEKHVCNSACFEGE